MLLAGILRRDVGAPAEGQHPVRDLGRAASGDTGIRDGLVPGKVVSVVARRAEGGEIQFQAVARLDTPVEVEYYRNGGILQTILRRMARTDEAL